jgi:cation:H+ antiporter
MFNIVIIAVDDLFYRQGPVLAAVSESHVFTGLVVLAMTCLVMLGVVTRTRRKTRLGFSWYVPLLIGLAAVSAYVSFARG